jgi:ABC-2 type transport system permease protein
MTDTARPADPFPPGTFRPDPGPAPAAVMVRAAAAAELRIQLRNGEQLLLALVIPLAVLVGMTYLTVVDLPTPRVDAVVPGVVTLAVMSSAFTAQAISTAFDRRYGVLKRLAAAGMSRTLLIAGKCVCVATVVLGQLVVIGAIAMLMGWRPGAAALWAIPVVVLGGVAFTGLGLLLGGTLRAEAVLALANIAWFIMLALGGVLVPLSSGPGWLQVVAGATPAGALSEALRAVLQDGRAPGPWSLAVLVVWALIGWFGTVRWFRWL